MTIQKAYATGRETAHRGMNVTEAREWCAPFACHAEMVRAFWNGRKDALAEQRLDADTEWDSDAA